MNALKFFVITLSTVIFVKGAYASSDCPWQNWSPTQIREFSSDSLQIKSLTAEQVQQDLNCLSVVIASQYSLLLQYPNAIVPKISAAIKTAAPMSNVELLNQIFEFHEGFIDTHLSYEVAGQHRQFTTVNPEFVTLTEELPAEYLFIRKNYTYFKPAKILDTKLSESQTDFVEYIQKNDRPLVIDLRGVQGGSNTLAKELSQRLFHRDQHIPQSNIWNIESPLKAMTYCTSILRIYGDEYKDFCHKEIKAVEHLTFSDLLKRTIQKDNRTEQYLGKRASLYQSPIYLIFDSSCASACETIIDKLHAHPNVKSLGAHSYGALHYSNALSMVLPNSGIQIRIPTRHEVMETDVPEGHGYLPDLLIKHIDLENILSL